MSSLSSAARSLRSGDPLSRLQDMMPAAPLATPDDQTDFRQLRHQTKNALQRLLCEISRAAETRDSPEAQEIFADLERRVRLSASISDALFGFTAMPPPLADRLRALSRAMIATLAASGQRITFHVSVAGVCPARQTATLLRVAHEMLGNALRHGFAARPTGRITIRVTADARWTRLVVSDDGIGPDGRCDAGEGMRLMEELAGAHGGTIALRRRAGFTMAELEMPRA